MEKESPSVVVLAGPNGAGKSTIARKLFPSALNIDHYVNADAIAHGLSAFRSESMALKAGRIMLEHIQDLGSQRVSFGFETTLATKSFAPSIKELKKTGYGFHLFFLWLPSPQMAMDRVKERVARGGHNIPADTIVRRYQRGLDNFFRLYRPLANFWKVFNNANPKKPKQIAEGDDKIEKVHDPGLWARVQEASKR